MIKRINLIALISVSLSYIALADNSTPPEKQKPCHFLCTQNTISGFYVGVTGIYAKPSESGNGVAGHSLQYTAPNGQTTSENHPYTPSNSGGIGAKLGYDFGASANSIEFDYLHFTNSTSDVSGSEGDPASFGSIFFPDLIVPDPASLGINVHSKLSYNLNQYDLWLAHTFSSSVPNFSFKPAIGVRYATLSHNLTFDTPGAVKSNFQGLGPEIGFDAHYTLGYGFGIIGHFDDAILASRVDGSSYISNPPYGINAAFDSPDNNRVSNAITGRLGADYKYVFSNGSSLALEGGYQAMNYADAFDIIQGNAIAAEQRIVGISSNDFSLRGPYLSLTYHA
ncbi:MAG: hypothetical protein K0R48_403 [Gammaproteobacteria bacterium]|jgi:hypothetical protein|nr:hypothetical protein [Gammaproteobacteria bacterium]